MHHTNPLCHPSGVFLSFVTSFSEAHMSSPAPHHLSTPTPPSGIHSVFSLCFRWQFNKLSRKISIMPFSLVNSILQNTLSWELIFFGGCGELFGSHLSLLPIYSQFLSYILAHRDHYITVKGKKEREEAKRSKNSEEEQQGGHSTYKGFLPSLNSLEIGSLPCIEYLNICHSDTTLVFSDVQILHTQLST